MFATHDSVDRSLLGAMEPPAVGVGSSIMEGIDYHMNAFIDSLSEMIDGALGKVASGLDKGISLIGGMGASKVQAPSRAPSVGVSAPVVSAPKVQTPAIPDHVKALALASVGAAYSVAPPEPKQADSQSYAASLAELGEMPSPAIYQGMQLVIERNQQAGYARSVA
jgi:hypothetical protein